MIPFLDLSIDSTLRAEIDKEINLVLDGGNYILGKKVEEFEKKFASFIGAGNTIGSGSGTDSLRLAIRACGVKPGDKVLTVAFTSPFTSVAILEEGAIPVFCDIDENTLTIDVEDIKRKIDSKVKAIIPVHIYGNPCNMAGILRAVSGTNIKIIEDACQAHGASIKTKKVGSFGDAAAFSFYPTKNLGALGDGGAVTTNNKQIAQMARYLRNGGQTKRFWHKYKGFNSRLDELQAAILLVKLKFLEENNKKRETIVNKYMEAFSNLPLSFQQTNKGGKSSNHLFVIRTKKRDALKNYLIDLGIGCDIYYPWTLNKLPLFSKYNTKLPVTTTISREILALPAYPTLKQEDQETVIKSVRKFF